MGEHATHDDPSPGTPVIIERFSAALLGAGGPDAGGADLLPSRLAWACREVLGVDGSGIGVMSEAFRIPVGASDEQAVAAERLQFTVGEGPCLAAVGTHRIVVANESVIQTRWPVFHDELLERSPFRSIVAIPLRIAPYTAAALDLYFHHPTHAQTLNLTDAADVAALIAAVLSQTAVPSTPPGWPGIPIPDWMYGAPARNRLRTWIAVGVLMAHFGASPADALDRLRAHAYVHDQLLEDVADALITGALPPTHLAL